MDSIKARTLYSGKRVSSNRALTNGTTTFLEPEKKF